MKISTAMPRMLSATASCVFESRIGKITVVVLSFFLTVTGTNAATIDYAPDGPVVEFWGPGAGAAGGPVSYGQIFTAPETVLQSYSLIVTQGNSTSFPFVSQI